MMLKQKLGPMAGRPENGILLTITNRQSTVIRMTTKLIGPQDFLIWVNQLATLVKSRDPQTERS